MIKLNFTVIIVESIIYIIVGIIVGYLLKGEELKKIKRLILIFYLVIGIAVYSILYFIILSAVVLLAAAAALKFYEY
ncbi:MAG: hypothetical protein ACYCSQ_09850 [bacterium]|jgi:hypothetical protein|uniref:ABC transmembrane type-1 domain-containing protein n=1 Tax=Candidatus Acididesulfobacter diazotrophicus TaxID=2597226 RepID=A0A519BLU2_9DELT|nr:MAG: hypothetical protein EVG15_07050 [Candidatus Acididesulfobacter diazotrophicus]